MSTTLQKLTQSMRIVASRCFSYTIVWFLVVSTRLGRLKIQKYGSVPGSGRWSYDVEEAKMGGLKSVKCKFDDDRHSSRVGCLMFPTQTGPDPREKLTGSTSC